MERENRQEALRQLLKIAAANGYVTFDDIFECADAHSLSIGDFDWLSEAAASRQVIIYDKAPQPVSESDDEYDDFAQIDYEHTFEEVIRICPELRQTIDAIRGILPPQRGEVGRIKYQVQEGNDHARTRMVEMYLRLAVRIALSRAKTYDLDLEETIGDAFAGLLIAVDKYDPDSSGSFVSFASLWIYQNISREQSTRNANVYFPVHRKEWYYTMYPILKNRGCLECEKILQCEKVRSIICEKIQCERGQAGDVLLASLPCMSLDELVENGVEDPSLVCYDEELLEEVSSSSQADEVRKALNTLTEREQEVLSDRYGLEDGIEKTLEQVGQKQGITRERVRQIESKALRRVAAYYTGNYRPASEKDKHKKPKIAIDNNKAITATGKKYNASTRQPLQRKSSSVTSNQGEKDYLPKAVLPTAVIQEKPNWNEPHIAQLSESQIQEEKPPEIKDKPVLIEPKKDQAEIELSTGTTIKENLVPFSIEEAVVLLDLLVNGRRAGYSKMKIAEQASERLRLYAINRGTVVGDSYRTPGGIAGRLTLLDAMLNGRPHTKPATEVFERTIQLYREESETFQVILLKTNGVIDKSPTNKVVSATDNHSFRAEEERRIREEAERKAQEEEAARKAEEEHRIREEAERKAREEEAARKAEEERRLQEELRAKAEEERRIREEAERKKREAEQKLAEEQAKYDELQDDIKLQRKIIEDNRAWFGAKARARKAAQEALESLLRKISEEYPNGRPTRE